MVGGYVVVFIEDFVGEFCGVMCEIFCFVEFVSVEKEVGEIVVCLCDFGVFGIVEM